MSDPTSDNEPAFHLLVDPDEVPVAVSALRLLISDEAHQPEIRGLARAVLDRLQADPAHAGVLEVPLSPQEMKITYTAVRLLLNDTQRGQTEEREILWRILEKLPDEHTMRAISLD
jgi:hypothetical protein